MRKILSICASLVFSIAFAQVKTNQLQEVVVTATNSQQKIQETGRNVITIPGSLFEKLAINSIDELLKYTNGIEVQQRGPQGSQSDILIRGGTFQQVLVLLDGIRLNDPLTGHFNGNIPIHPAAIERIEIVKGPASGVWGADAVGGVINIITKAFSTIKKGNNNINLGFQFGQYGQVNANVNAAGGKNGTYYNLGLLSNNAEGPQLRGTTAFFKNNTLHGAVQKLLKDNWILSFKSVVDRRSFNAQNFYTTFKSDTANESVNSFFNHLQLSKQWDGKSITNDVSYKALSDEFQFNSVGTANKNKTKQLIYQFNFQNKINETTKFTTGLQLMNRSINSNDRGNHNLWSFGTYFILKHELAKNWYMNEGIRVDYNENYGTVLSPQFNLIYNPNKWVFRTSFAQGIRDADFTERFNNYNRSLVTSGSIGNPDLKTENTWNTEIGADFFSSQFKFSTTLFYRQQKNLIDWAVTPYANMPRKTNLIPAGNYALATNLSKVTTAGIEFDVNYKKEITPKQQLILNYNLTYLDSKTDQSVVSFYIIGHANWLSTLNIVYQHKNFNIALNSLYKARPARNAAAINAELTKDYFLLNSKIGYYLPKTKTNIFVQVTNALDKKYSDVLGAQMPGRWISGGVQINL